MIRECLFQRAYPLVKHRNCEAIVRDTLQMRAAESFSQMRSTMVDNYGEKA